MANSATTAGRVLDSGTSSAQRQFTRMRVRIPPPPLGHEGQMVRRAGLEPDCQTVGIQAKPETGMGWPPQPLRLAGAGVTSESFANTGSGSFNPAAAMFSSRWATDDVPGIGTATGERRNNHASATWNGVARSSWAAASRALLASRFWPRGAQGRNAILCEIGRAH